MYKTILFDFDGTVFDTVEGITKCIQYALRKHGIDEPDLSKLRCFAGPPLVDKFMEVYGVTEEEGNQLVLDFRERYAPVGVFESRPFPGIGGLLAHLRAAGFALGVATSKPQVHAELLLERAGLSGAFDIVVGSTPGANNQRKYMVVARAMEGLGASKEETVLIGDTKYDVEGAALVGIPCIGVRWGYAAEGELEAAGAIAIAADMAELERMLTGGAERPWSANGEKRPDKADDKKQLNQAADAALRWYAENARDLPWRKDPTPYHIWLSEIIFQQTRIEAGTSYYLRFLEEAPDVHALAAMDEEKLMKLWQGLGYYSRARNLQKAARTVVSEYGGAIPDDPKELAKLPGIGSYTAGSIASIAFGKPVPAVDGNVLRVVSRLLAREDDIALPETKKRLEAELADFYAEYFAESAARPGDLNQAWMDIGATVCLPNGEPRCESCPFGAFCEARKEGRETELPVRSKAKPRTVENRTVFVLRCRFAVEGESIPQTMIYLRKRPIRGLLAGLWELPGEPGFLSAAETEETVRSAYVPCASEVVVTALPDAKHVFSHVEWRMKGYLVDVVTPCTEYGADRSEHPHILCTNGSRDETAVWASPEEIETAYSVPSAFRAYQPYLTGDPDGPSAGAEPTVRRTAAGQQR